MAPSEFWLLSPQEWFWELDAKVEEAKRMQPSNEESGSAFSQSEWADARRRHAEKMKQNGS
jgi:hypothetical protein